MLSERGYSWEPTRAAPDKGDLSFAMVGFLRMHLWVHFRCRGPMARLEALTLGGLGLIDNRTAGKARSAPGATRARARRATKLVKAPRAWRAAPPQATRPTADPATSLTFQRSAPPATPKRRL